MLRSVALSAVVLACVAMGTAAGATDGVCSTIAPAERVDCAFPGISMAQCLDRKCCWDASQASSVPQCYYPGSGVPVKTVHVIEACHLDVGYKAMAHDIVNLYFDTHFPNAIRWAQELRKAGGPQQLMFMTQSYLVSLFMHCPAGMKLHCPNATYVGEFTAAVKRGDIYWHAFPFNAEPEVMSPLEVAFGVQMTHDLDALFGLPKKVTLSQRDVPGMSRSAVPILAAAGVQAISVGVNTASKPPNVPKAFLWRDPVSNVTMPSMWHPKGYGGITLTDAVVVPGSSHALVFLWNGDNNGPPPIPMIDAAWGQLEQEFPGAAIVASTFDNFTQHLLKHTDGLPELTTEIGDTWVYGVPSDPFKVAQMRAINRARTACLSDGSCSTADAEVYNMSRLFVKSAEHTWGEDVKAYLHDYTNWTNAEFDAVRNSASNYINIQDSWIEQRNWGVDFPVQALNGNALADAIDAEFQALAVNAPNPAADGFKRVTSTAPTFHTPQYDIGFDTSTGAVNHLVHLSSGGMVLANTSKVLGLLEYRTYDTANIDTFFTEYFDVSPVPGWASKDFGKPGINVTHPADKVWLPTAQSLWYKQEASTSTLTVLVNVAFTHDAVALYGAPASVWINVTVTPDAGVQFDFEVINKTATRLPESMFVRFDAAVAPVSTASADDGSISGWAMDKLGEYISPTDVQNGAAKHLHGLHTGLRYTTSAATGAITTPPAPGVYLDTLDAAVVAWTSSKPTAFPTPCTGTTSLDDGPAFLLWDNLWGTNYVMWWPFLGGEQANMRYRFHLYVQ